MLFSYPGTRAIVTNWFASNFVSSICLEIRSKFYLSADTARWTDDVADSIFKRNKRLQLASECLYV